MKTRIIVAVFGIPVLFAVIFFAPVWALGILVGIIAGRSAWELLRCAEHDMPRRMRWVTSICAGLVPLASVFFPAGRVYELSLFALFVYVFCELMCTFRKETPMALETATVNLLAGGIMPVLISAIVRLGLREHGPVYVVLPFVTAFSCDAGAYFAGLAFGKRKITPHLSPHKTLEGCIGGFLSAIVFQLLYGLILRAADFEVNLAVMAVYGFLGALACQLGDLCFSSIKRLCGVKDYGTLIPGHGGMLDRFDSMFWVAALTEFLVAWVPAITKLVP